MINLCSKVAGRLSSTHTAAHRWAGIGVGVQSSKRVVSTTASANRSTNMSSSEYIAAYVTVPSQELGSKIATALLTDKLVACVNIIPGKADGQETLHASTCLCVLYSLVLTWEQ